MERPLQLQSKPKIEQKERENKQTTQAQDDVVRKSPSRPIVKKPF